MGRLSTTTPASAKGIPHLYKYDFAFDTPGLADGIEVYTPQVGDVLLNWFVDLRTVFDGTTPKFDIGTFVGADQGWIARWNSVSAVPTLANASTSYGGTGLSFNEEVNLSAFAVQQDYGIDNSPNENYNYEGVFTDTNPLKIVVSQSGEIGGDPIGGAAGAATLYLLIAHPHDLTP